MRANLSSMTQARDWSACIGWPVKMCLASGFNVTQNCASGTCMRTRANRQGHAVSTDCSAASSSAKLWVHFVDRSLTADPNDRRLCSKSCKMNWMRVLRRTLRWRRDGKESDYFLCLMSCSNKSHSNRKAAQTSSSQSYK